MIEVIVNEKQKIIIIYQNKIKELTKNIEIMLNQNKKLSEQLTNYSDRIIRKETSIYER